MKLEQPSEIKPTINLDLTINLKDAVSVLVYIEKTVFLKRSRLEARFGLADLRDALRNQVIPKLEFLEAKK